MYPTNAERVRDVCNHHHLPSPPRYTIRRWFLRHRFSLLDLRPASLILHHHHHRRVHSISYHIRIRFYSYQFCRFCLRGKGKAANRFNMTVHSITMHNKQNKIKRWDLADQLREYQIRSKLDWASFSFFSDNAKVSYSFSRMDMMMFVLWELLIIAFIVSSIVSLYFAHLRLTLVLATVAWLLMLCMKVTKQVKLNRKTNRRMMLPLSM